jgi:Ras-related protein Rab-1A
MDRTRVEKYDACFKVIVIGNSGVGKTCIVRRYVDNLFSQSFITTIGIDFKIQKVIRDDKHIKLQIWDTAGQERFRTITASYYRGCDAVVLVYDVTDRDSFESVSNWALSLSRHVDEKCIVKILVGNKMDNEKARKVTYSEGATLAKKMGISFFECSSKLPLPDGNIPKIFDAICDGIIPSFFGLAKKIPNKIHLDDPPKPPSKCC